MKKLLSLALVLTMLFTIIAVPSVSAATVQNYLTGDYKTVVKLDFENGESPFGTAGVSYNCFTYGAVDSANASSTQNSMATFVDYSATSVTPPIGTGEDFGSKVMRATVTDKTVKYSSYRFRCPIAKTSENSYLPNAGSKYRASVWVYVASTIDSADTTASATFYFGDGVQYGPNNKVYTLKKGEWTKMSVEFAVTSAYAKGLVYTIEFKGIDSKCYAKDVFIDNYRLEEFQTTKTASEILGSAELTATTGKPVGTVASSKFTLQPSANGSVKDITDTNISGVYAVNDPTVTIVDTETLRQRGSAIHYPGISNSIAKYSITANNPLFRFKNLINATSSSGSTASGDKLKFSVNVYATDVVAHAKKNEANGGAIGGSATLDKMTLSYQAVKTTATSDGGNGQAAGTDANVPINKWYRLEMCFSANSDYINGIRVHGAYGANKIEAYNQPFASSLYFDDPKIERLTDPTANVTLTATVEGSETATITGPATVVAGTKTTLTATDKTTDGKVFEGWYDGYVCVGRSPSYTFYPFADTKVVAKYVERKHEVSISALNGGTAKGNGTYAYGQSVTVSATANPGYVFDGWYNKTTYNGAILSYDSEYTFDVTDDMSLVAAFRSEASYTFGSNVKYFFGAEASDLNVNTGGVSGFHNTGDSVTSKMELYSVAGISKPSQSNVVYVDGASEKKLVDEEFGSNVYKLAWHSGTTVTNKNLTINTRIRFLAGSGINANYDLAKRQKFSMFVYPAKMSGEKYKTVNADIFLTSTGNTTSDVAGQSRRVTLTVGKWNYVEFEFEATAVNNTKQPGIRMNFLQVYQKDENGEDVVDVSSFVTEAYIDNLKIEEFSGYHFGYEENDVGDEVQWVKFDGDELNTALGTNDGVVKDVAKNLKDAEGNAIVSPNGDNNTKVAVLDARKFITEEKTADKITDFGFRIKGLAGSEIVDKKIVYHNANYVVGRTYRLSVKVYPVSMVKDGQTTAYFSIFGTNDKTEKSDITGQAATFVPTTVGQWNELTYTFVATEENNNNAPGIYVRNKNYKDSGFVTCIYVDDLIIEELDVSNIGLTFTPNEDRTEFAAHAVVSALSGSTSSAEAIIIVAAYDELGKLIKVETSANKKLTLSDNTLEYTMGKVDNANTYTAFLWNNLEEIRPYTLPVEVGALAE